MNHVMSGRHPDDDVLADLAAEVLPEHEARTVEAHVIGCGRCADLLADAERVRRLLVADDPGPMPGDVLARIESALRAEAQSRSRGDTHAASAHHVPVVDRGESWDGDGPTPWDDPASWDREPGIRSAGARGPGGSRRPAGRRGSTAVRSRRDGRPERLGPVRRHATLLTVAAGLVVVVGLGGLLVVSVLGGGRDSTATMAGAASASTSAASGEPLPGVRFTASRTEYTSGNFVSRATALARRSATQASGQACTLGQRTSEDRDGGAATEASGAAALRDPQRLRECLAAIEAPGTPVAVDIARYEGKEAAIIVLPVQGGGYEAWAVDPNCGPAGDGLLTFREIPAP